VDARLVAGTVVLAVLLLGALIDYRDGRRRSVHRRRSSLALWIELDERSSAMRAGEHGLFGHYVPETVPWRPGRHVGRARRRPDGAEVRDPGPTYPGG
jgi:hypothetical protein